MRRARACGGDASNEACVTFSAQARYQFCACVKATCEGVVAKDKSKWAPEAERFGITRFNDTDNTKETQQNIVDELLDLSIQAFAWPIRASVSLCLVHTIHSYVWYMQACVWSIQTRV